MLAELPASFITTAEVEIHAAPATAAIAACLLESPRTRMSKYVTTKYTERS
jgi:hypothetical protein